MKFILVMTVTFFCKRGRHQECPESWPVNDFSPGDHDCSFDVKLTKCLCECHNTLKGT